MSTLSSSRRWSVILALGGCALVAALFASIKFSDVNAAIHGPPAIESSSKSKPEASVILMGMGDRRVAAFHLVGGTYRVVWAAWGPAAEFPPCTHSAELVAVDPANGTTSSGHVADLAKFAHVPATGASEERFVPSLRTGDYYVDVHSECGWQIAFSLAD